MSGKPSYEGVKRFREILGRLTTAESMLDNANRDMADAQRRGRKYGEECEAARKELFKLLEDMDVKAEGNAGYEGRASWFFTQLHRQFADELSEARAVRVVEN